LGRMTGPVDREDVLSWGIIGLLDAIETYDPERRTKFESYAVSKIRWAILDELRRADSLTRRVRRRANVVELATSELAQRLGRAPTEKEVARKLASGSPSTGPSSSVAREFRLGRLRPVWNARVTCTGSRPIAGRQSAVGRGDGGAARSARRGDTGFRGAGAGGDYLLFLRTADLEGDRRVPQPHRGSHLADTAPGAS
jgi:hypothetical protein